MTSLACYERAMDAGFDAFCKQYHIHLLHPECIMMWTCDKDTIAVAGEDLYAYTQTLCDMGGRVVSCYCDWLGEEVEAAILSKKRYWQCLKMFQ